MIPGGRAPEYLRLDADVIAAVSHFMTADKPVAAICHGAQILTAARVIEGRTVSAYPACRPEVELAGAIYADIAVDAAVTDGNLVTAPAWPAHPAWLAQSTPCLAARLPGRSQPDQVGFSQVQHSGRSFETDLTVLLRMRLSSGDGLHGAISIRAHPEERASAPRRMGRGPGALPP